MKNRRLNGAQVQLKQFFTANDFNERRAVHSEYELLEMINEINENYKSKEILNSIPDGIVGINEENLILIFNERAETIFGYSEQELIGQSLDILIPSTYTYLDHEPSGNNIYGSWDVPMEDSKKKMFGQRKNGEEFPLSVSLSYINTSLGKIAFAAIRDITGQIKTETELRETTKHLKELFELTPDAIVIHNFETITHVNQVYLDLLGFENTETVLGNPMTITQVSPEGTSIVEATKLRLEKEKTVFLPEVKHLKNDGTFVLTESHVSNVFFNGILHQQIISRDITSRKDLENKVEKKKKLLNEAERLSNLGSWDWDIESNVVSWSDEAYRIYGLDKNTFIPTYEGWLKRLHPEDKDEIIAKITESYKVQNEVDFEYRIIRPNGEIRHVKNWNMMEFYADGRPMRMLGALLDVTEITMQKVALQNLATNFGALRGNEFFNRVSSYLASTLNVSYAFIGKLINGNKIKVIGGVGKGEILDFGEYSLSGTPCANAINQGVCTYRTGVQELFPEDQLLIDMNIAGYVGSHLVDAEGNAIGIIVLLNEEEIPNPEVAASTLQIFSERASAEIQRLDSESKLAISEEKLAIINNNSPDLIYTINSDLEITYANREVNGISPQDALGRSLLDFIPTPYHNQLKQNLQDAFAGEKQEFELKTHPEINKDAWHSIRISKINNHENSSRLLVVVTEITERKKVEIRNSIVNSISNKLSSNMSIDEFCRFVFSELQMLKPFHDLYISNYDEAKNELSVFFQAESNTIKTNLPEPRIAGKGLSEHIIKTKKGLALNGDEMSAFHKQHDLKIYGLAAKSWIGVPLMSENKVIGVLAAQCFYQNNTYTESDLSLLSFVGTQIGTFIEKARADKEINQFEKYFSISMDLLCIAGNDGFFKKINPKFSEILSYTEEELLTNSFLEFVHPDDIDKTIAQIERLSLGLKTIDFTNRYRCKDGTYKWFIWAAASDPKTQDIYAAAKEVTEQMETRERLTALAEIQDSFIAESTSKDSFERMLNLLLDLTESTGGFIGEVIYNRKGPTLKTHAITIASKLEECTEFHDENAPKRLEFENFRHLFDTIVTNGKHIISNNPNSELAGEELSQKHPEIQCFMGIPFYNGKELIGMVGFANKPNGYEDKDVEQLAPFLATCSTLLKAYRNSEKKLQAEKEASTLADIVSYSSDAIVSISQEGRVLSWNSGAQKLFGYSMAEIIGTSVAKLSPKELRKIHVKIFQEVLNGKSVESYETLQVKKGDTLIHVNMSIFPLIDEQGYVKGISSILRDISEQKEAQKIKEEFTKNLEIKVRERTQDLEKAQLKLSLSLEKEKELGELKSRFVSTVSHQFRTPLSVIQASIGILDIQKNSMTGTLKSSFEKVYDRIKGQIRRMTNLMDEVLILSKIDAGNIKPSLKSTDLVSLCEEVASSYNEIQEDGRKIGFVVNGIREMIPLDAKLMEHAISNLVSNAFKYSVGKGNPSMSIHFEETHIEISIKDQGIGIPENDLNHLFDPFYRASNSGDHTGTGLGSTIAKDYIELNGGEITVKTEQNVGSEFIVVFKK